MGGRTVEVDLDGETVVIPRKKVRKTRAGGVRQEVKEKFKEEREARVVPVIAKTENQKIYLDSLQMLGLCVTFRKRIKMV